MTDSLRVEGHSVRDPDVGSVDSLAASQLRRRFTIMVLGMAGLTWLLMGLGSATRVMNAGLSCPDWPLCYGTLLPPMNLQVFLEWFHRLVAASLGATTVVLVGAAWWYRRLLPSWFSQGSLLALGLVMVQGLLGGLTVTELLRFDIVTAHLGTGLLFFITLVILGTLLSHGSRTDRIASSSAGTQVLTSTALVASLLIYGQSLLGALVASRWAVHQCLSGQSLCTVLNSHLIGVVPTTLGVVAVLVVGLWHWRRWRFHTRWSLGVIGTLLGLQIALGLGTFYFHLQVEPLTVAHQMVGAALLAAVVLVACWGRQQQLEA